MVNAYFNPPANEVSHPYGNVILWSSTDEPIRRSSFRPASCSHRSSIRIGKSSSNFELRAIFDIDVLCRPSYLAYGAFGHVASHELTVKMASLVDPTNVDLTHIWFLFIHSTPLIPRAVSTTKMESWSSGGLMRPVTGSMKSRNASLISSLVSIFLWYIEK